jgi:hypothetical protein
LSFHSCTLLEHASDLPLSQDRVCKIEFVRSLRTPFYLRVLPRIPPSNDHCTHFLIFYFNPAQWLRHIPERYTRHVLAETSCDTRLFEISAHDAWPHVIFRI